MSTTLSPQTDTIHLATDSWRDTPSLASLFSQTSNAFEPSHWLESFVDARFFAPLSAAQSREGNALPVQSLARHRMGSTGQEASFFQLLGNFPTLFTEEQVKRARSLATEGPAKQTTTASARVSRPTSDAPRASTNSQQMSWLDELVSSLETPLRAQGELLSPLASAGLFRAESDDLITPSLPRFPESFLVGFQADDALAVPRSALHTLNRTQPRVAPEGQEVAAVPSRTLSGIGALRASDSALSNSQNTLGTRLPSSPSEFTSLIPIQSDVVASTNRMEPPRIHSGVPVSWQYNVAESVETVGAVRPEFGAPTQTQESLLPVYAPATPTGMREPSVATMPYLISSATPATQQPTAEPNKPILAPASTRPPVEAARSSVTSAEAPITVQSEPFGPIVSPTVSTVPMEMAQTWTSVPAIANSGFGTQLRETIGQSQGSDAGALGTSAAAESASGFTEGLGTPTIETRVSEAPPRLEESTSSPAALLKPTQPAAAIDTGWVPSVVSFLPAAMEAIASATGLSHVASAPAVQLVEPKLLATASEPSVVARPETGLQAPRSDAMTLAASDEQKTESTATAPVALDAFSHQLLAATSNPGAAVPDGIRTAPTETVASNETQSAGIVSTTAQAEASFTLPVVPVWQTAVTGADTPGVMQPLPANESTGLSGTGAAQPLLSNLIQSLSLASDSVANVGQWTELNALPSMARSEGSLTQRSRSQESLQERHQFGAEVQIPGTRGLDSNVSDLTLDSGVYRLLEALVNGTDLNTSHVEQLIARSSSVGIEAALSSLPSTVREAVQPLFKSDGDATNTAQALKTAAVLLSAPGTLRQAQEVVTESLPKSRSFAATTTAVSATLTPTSGAVLADFAKDIAPKGAPQSERMPAPFEWSKVTDEGLTNTLNLDAWPALHAIASMESGLSPITGRPALGGSDAFIGSALAPNVERKTTESEFEATPFPMARSLGTSTRSELTEMAQTLISQERQTSALDLADAATSRTDRGTVTNTINEVSLNREAAVAPLSTSQDIPGVRSKQAPVYLAAKRPDPGQALQRSLSETSEDFRPTVRPIPGSASGARAVEVIAQALTSAKSLTAESGVQNAPVPPVAQPDLAGSSAESPRTQSRESGLYSGEQRQSEAAQLPSVEVATGIATEQGMASGVAATAAYRSSNDALYSTNAVAEFNESFARPELRVGLQSLLTQLMNRDILTTSTDNTRLVSAFSNDQGRQLQDEYVSVLLEQGLPLNLSKQMAAELAPVLREYLAYKPAGDAVQASVLEPGQATQLTSSVGRDAGSDSGTQVLQLLQMSRSLSETPVQPLRIEAARQLLAQVQEQQSQFTTEDPIRRSEMLVQLATQLIDGIGTPSAQVASDGITASTVTSRTAQDSILTSGSLSDTASSASGIPSLLPPSLRWLETVARGSTLSAEQLEEAERHLSAALPVASARLGQTDNAGRGASDLLSQAMTWLQRAARPELQAVPLSVESPRVSQHTSQLNRLGRTDDAVVQPSMSPALSVVALLETLGQLAETDQPDSGSKPGTSAPQSQATSASASSARFNTIEQSGVDTSPEGILKTALNDADTVGNPGVTQSLLSGILGQVENAASFEAIVSSLLPSMPPTLMTWLQRTTAEEAGHSAQNSLAPRTQALVDQLARMGVHLPRLTPEQAAPITRPLLKTTGEKELSVSAPQDSTSDAVRRAGFSPSQQTDSPALTPFDANAAGILESVLGLTAGQRTLLNQTSRGMLEEGSLTEQPQQRASGLRNLAHPALEYLRNPGFESLVQELPVTTAESDIATLTRPAMAATDTAETGQEPLASIRPTLARVNAGRGELDTLPEGQSWLASAQPLYDEDDYSDRPVVSTLSARRPPESGPSIDQLVRGFERMFSRADAADDIRDESLRRASDALLVPPQASRFDANASTEAGALKILVGRMSDELPSHSVYPNQIRQQALPMEALASRNPSQPEPATNVTRPRLMDSNAESDIPTSALTQSLAQAWNVNLPGTEVVNNNFSQVLLTREPIMREVTGESQEVYAAHKDHQAPSVEKHQLHEDKVQQELDIRGMEQAIAELRWRLQLNEKWDEERE